MTREEIEEAISKEIRDLKSKTNELRTDLEKIETTKKHLENIKTNFNKIKSSLTYCSEHLSKGLSIDGKSADDGIIKSKSEIILGYSNSISEIVSKVETIISTIEAQIETNNDQQTMNSVYLTNHIIPEKYEPYWENPNIK